MGSSFLSAARELGLSASVEPLGILGLILTRRPAVGASHRRHRTTVRGGGQARDDLAMLRMQSGLETCPTYPTESLNPVATTPMKLTLLGTDLLMASMMHMVSLVVASAILRSHGTFHPGKSVRIPERSVPATGTPSAARNSIMQLVFLDRGADSGFSVGNSPSIRAD